MFIDDEGGFIDGKGGLIVGFIIIIVLYCRLVPKGGFLPGHHFL